MKPPDGLYYQYNTNTRRSKVLIMLIGRRMRILKRYLTKSRAFGYNTPMQ